LKVANLGGRASIILEDGSIDIAEASNGRFSSSIDDLIPQIKELKAWYKRTKPAQTGMDSISQLLKNPEHLGPVVNRPRQIFAVGLNYRSHGKEMNIDIPSSPMIFTKFASSLTGAGQGISLPSETCDWEVELVAVIGKGGRNISKQNALSHICGYCIGQDISERESQLGGSFPQFSLAKSFEGFAPVGPWITTADEIKNIQNLSIECSLDDDTLQKANTSMMIFDVETLIEYLSSICELYPGDLIFTGTPEGVGFSRTPQRWLKKDTTLYSKIENLGSMKNKCV